MVFNTFIHIAREVGRGVCGLAFPNVCICCGLETTEEERQLCSFCKEERFTDANPANMPSSSGVILPDCVSVQHALWQFDKGGALQAVMHYLKYERLTGVGIELGGLMAERMLKHPALKRIISKGDCVLLPVPLHFLKFRKRGFNQAFMIARGIQKALDIPICSLKDVVRTKNTRTQTGFTIARRISNISGAFRVNNPEAFRGKTVFIVDDVFTTGSTTFELARTVSETGSRDIVILTAAQA